MATRHSLLRYFTTRISRKYFSTPGWISSIFGAAATVFARRGLAGLRQLLAERGFGPVQRPRQPVGDVIRQAFACEHKAP